jgi:glycosyltransferase involved in cell wall biosynthesis
VVWHGAYSPADLAGAPIDVAVLPTLCAESYSFALDEACALGIPVLATQLGALVDRATPRIALFPRGDARVLASLLARLAQNPLERRRMSEAPAPARIDAADHLATLQPLYAALASTRPESPASEPDRQLDEREHAFTLREAGLKELLRSEGWEDVVARLTAENEALRREE